jgi:hypothetical protein
MASSATPQQNPPQSPAATQVNIANLKTQISNLKKELKKYENIENKLTRLKRKFSSGYYYNNNNRYGYGRGRSRTSTYKLREGETGFFDGKLRRFFFNPELGFYTKIFNPRTGKLVSVPRRGTFVYQNVGNRIVRYSARRQMHASPRITSPRQIKRENLLERQLARLSGMVGYKSEDPKFKYRHTYR